MIKDRILYEDNDILVCHKPAGIATQTARVGQADMVSEAANYLASAEEGCTRPYVGVVHRLDQPVEGILVFAKNGRAAADLGRQLSDGRMEKYYYAVVCGHRLAPDGELTDYLVKDGRTNMSRVVPPETQNAKKAVLEYRIVSKRPCKEGNALQTALVRVRLHTGRHHQIRVQMSHAGMGLLGDYRYADAEVREVSEAMRVKEIALCAYKLAFRHPASGRHMQFAIRPEGRAFSLEDWQDLAENGLHNEP